VEPEGEIVMEAGPNADEPCKAVPEDEAPSEDMAPETDPADASLEPPTGELT